MVARGGKRAKIFLSAWTKHIIGASEDSLTLTALGLERHGHVRHAERQSMICGDSDSESGWASTKPEQARAVRDSEGTNQAGTIV